MGTKWWLTSVVVKTVISPTCFVMAKIKTSFLGSGERLLLLYIPVCAVLELSAGQSLQFVPVLAAGGG
jgi:hypothetical protein